MNYSDNYNFYLPSRDGEDAADINLISANFSVIDEKLKENETHQLVTQVIDNNAFDVVSLVEKTNKIIQGITYNWDGGKYHISGTARAYSFYNIVYFADTVPSYIKLGHTYRVKCSIPASVQFIIMFFKNNTTTNPETVTYYFDIDTTITIPDDITGICIRLGVSAGATVNNDITLSLLNAPTNQDLGQDIEILKNDNEKQQLMAQVIENNAFDVLGFADKTNKTYQGITYNWDNGNFHISGTATGYSFYNLVYFADSIPSYIKLGNTYRVRCSIPASVQFVFMFFKNNTTSDPETVTYYFDTDTTITIPGDITGICIRLGVSADATVDNDIELSVHNALTNQELEQEIKALKGGAVLTFIDDDGILEGLNNWQDVSDRTGVKITFALITGNIGGARYATWDDVERMKNSGFDFISHTHGHINLRQTSVEAIESDFIASQNALKEHGCNPEHFAYPFGYVPTDESKMSLIKHYFKSGIAIEYQENVPPLNTYKIMRESLVDTTRKVEHIVDGEVKEFYPVHSLDWFKDVIDTAKANNSWLIIMTHFRVAIDADGTGRYYVDESTKDLMVEVCKYAVSNGVKIQTYSEAFENFKNQLECGSVDDDSYYIVDCYGKIHER